MDGTSAKILMEVERHRSVFQARCALDVGIAESGCLHFGGGCIDGRRRDVTCQRCPVDADCKISRDELSQLFLLIVRKR